MRHEIEWLAELVEFVMGGYFDLILQKDVFPVE